MADIFISYSRADRRHVESLADYLSSVGWTIWWDKELTAGDSFRDEILHQLSAARAVIVLWSQNSITSDFVRAEASRAKSAGKLVPIKFADVDHKEIPLPFSEMHVELISNVDAIRRAVEARGRPIEGPLPPPAVLGPYYVSDRYSGPREIEKTPQEATGNLCALCASNYGKTGFEVVYSAHSVVIEMLRSKDGGYGLAGTIKTFECPYCSCAVRSVLQIVPLEMRDMVCRCGSKQFDFNVNEVALIENGSDWKFSLEMSCRYCKKSFLREALQSFFQLAGLKIEPTGLSADWRRISKS